MKIGHIAGVMTALGWCSACAHAPEAPAPSSSQRPSATVPAAEAQQAPTTPLPAPPPQGLSDDAAKASGRGAEEEFTNLESAERALDQAKTDLDRLALAEPSPVVGRSAAADRAPERRESKGKAPPSAAAPASSGPNPLCENACRAFSSLSRAANAVCRLDGSSGAHCTRAKRVVRESQPRVANCSCQAVGD